MVRRHRRDHGATDGASAGTDPRTFQPPGRAYSMRGRGMRMKTRTVGAWAGFLVTGVTLTGCTGTGASGTNYTRPSAALPTRTNTTPTAGQPTAATASGIASGWPRQPAAPASRTATDSTTPPSPNGNSPAMTNQPSSGITPAGAL